MDIISILIQYFKGVIMLKFDDIPDISHVASFLSENNLNVASNDDV